ncbi:MAG: hypothetical protein RLZZ360_764 [Candidatus Parcubacteria bacterium]|jgi:hypothetical protein
MIQKIILGIGALGLFYLGYVLFIQTDEFALEDSAVNPMADNLVAKTQVFIGRRAQLDQVAIESALFTDPRFTTLRSYTTELSDQSVGKSSIFELPDAVVNYNAASD